MTTILLHGLGQASSSWERTVEALGDRSNIFCPDLASWLDKKEPCYTNLYKELEKYCGQFSEPLNLCGLSLGGILALQYGIELPDKVNSLVLIGTQYSMPEKLLKFQNAVFHIMPNSAFQSMGFGKKEFISLTKSMMKLNFAHDLKKVTCPVLVICGEKDKANKAASLQLKEQIPNAEISIIADACHEVNMENPSELGRRMEVFFRKVKAGFAEP